jgi:HK97 family phage major capsid protein
MPKIDKRRLVGAGSLPEQFRVLEFEVKQTRAADDNQPALYELAVSTESEIERWYGVEVLEHSKAAIDMTRLKRGAAVLVDHRGDQVGVVEQARLDDDKVLRAEIRFSRSARGQEIERDVADGIRQSVSVGYFVKKAKLVETRAGGVDVWKITRWQPAEVSIVSVPADVMAGVGRSESQGRECPVELEHEETRAMKKVLGDNGAVIEVDDSDPRPAVREQATVGADAETKRAEGIRALCKGAGMMERAQDLIASPLTVEQVAQRIEAARATIGVAQPSAEQVVAALDAKSRKKYSYHRALKNAWAALEGKGKLDGVEGEMHAELERNWPTGATRKGTLLIPMDLRTEDERLELMYQRTATSFGAAKGVETVFQQYGQLIDMLRNRTKVIQAGATVMTGLTGPVGFPKLTGGPTVEWASEDPAAGTTQSDLAWGLVQLAGKTLRGLVGFTRQFMAQSSVDAEGVTRSELSFGHSLAIDKGSIHGIGSGGQPQGVYRLSGVNTETFAGTPTYLDLINMITSIFADNADVNNMRWLMTPEMAGRLAQIPRFTNTDTPLWEGNFSEGSVLGYKSSTTNQISKTMLGLIDTGSTQHGIIFGNWAELLIGLFGALDLLLDPYTAADKQIIKVHSYQMADVVAKHAESFCVSSGATP